QDGAVLFFFGDRSVVGFFVKFESQDTQTDEFGNPVHTGVAELDKLKANPTISKLLSKQRPAAKTLLAAARAPRAAKRTRTGARQQPAVVTDPSGSETPISGTSGGVEASGLSFADTTTVIDPNRPFDVDDDSQFRNSQFVKN